MNEISLINEIGEKLNQFIDNNGLYLILVIVGFVFRYALLHYVLWDTKAKIEKICRDIIIVILLTLFWTYVDIDNDNNAKIAILLIVATMVYLTYGWLLIKQQKEKSFLLDLVKSFMVMFLSFSSFPSSIFGVIITISVACGIYIFFDKFEAKSDLIEIIYLCIEALAMSIYFYVCKCESPFVMVKIVIFLETFVYMINCLVKWGVKFKLGEDTKEYLDELMGVNNYY